MPTWIRCRDTTTGHHYDLRSDDIRLSSGRVELAAGHPAITGTTARPRPAKHRTTKTGRPVTQPTAEQPAETTKEEGNHGTA